MRISSINFNVFKTRSIANVEQQNQNPFAVQNNNTIAGGLKQDVFQNSSIQNAQPNAFAQKTAEIFAGFNEKYNNFKNQSKEFFAPVISFAGKINAGIQKLNSITVEDMVASLKKEMSLLTLDRDVRKYVKMPVSDLREELVKELA
ncbi:MAG: hypothetical protein MJ180_04510 [Candidatus Gastranaerophilales bacterium]|nr:hypothetical protein [Candidatus Gastranaerophilales bacterium]